MNTPAMPKQSIAVALSGGGSRAIAFHLGCLRALQNIGVLEHCRVLSTVSGGSVIGALYVAHEGSFDDFEQKVRKLLARGLLGPSLRTAVTTPEGIKALLCVLLLVAVECVLLPVQWLAGIISLLLPRASGSTARAFMGRAVVRRFASRTTILEETLNRELYHGRCLGDLKGRRPCLVAIATELRSGSAFYFSPLESGSWRFGKVDPTRIRLAHAVAASAAYPMFLPALDEVLTFERRDGSRVEDRVTLTDGGVYDNLGLAPLWPDRDKSISLGVEAVDTIIACRAGYGLRMVPPSIFFLSRLKASFAAVHDRAQNATMKRLFDLKASGHLRNFVLPYLGQVDERLAFPPDDLVRRGEMGDYPTNFSAMPDEWIEKLARRGEQLTLALIRENAPELLDIDRP